MRTFLAALLVLSLFSLPPVVPADTGQGTTAGVNLGYMQPGLWDVWYFDAPGGAVGIELSWSNLPFPPADYDLRLYRPGALDDGRLSDSELLAESTTRSWSQHAERLDLSLPAGLYLVAVVPFQTQGEVYTLQAEPGHLQFAAIALGCTSYEPFQGCPFV